MIEDCRERGIVLEPEADRVEGLARLDTGLEDTVSKSHMTHSRSLTVLTKGLLKALPPLVPCSV